MAVADPSKARPSRSPTMAESVLFRAALDQLGVPARRAMFVGDDRTADILGAGQMGLRTALIVRDEPDADDEGPAPDLRIETLTELLDHLPGRAKTVDTPTRPA